MPNEHGSPVGDFCGEMGFRSAEAHLLTAGKRIED
jgi:hypothetical protein